MDELLVNVPKIGVFLREYPGQPIQSNPNLVIESIDYIPEKKTRVWQIRVKNIGDQILHLNSFLIGEFEIPKTQVKDILENGWGQSSFSGYKPLPGQTRKSLFFLKRDQNPYSFRKDFGYLNKSIVNEWYTQLVGDDKAVVIGAVTTKDQYSQIYLKIIEEKIIIRITSQYDGLPLNPGESIYSEKVAIVTGSVSNSLEKFGNLIKKESGIRQVSKPPSGLCCAYYHQGNKVNEKYILEQLEVIDRIPGKLDLEYIQIDAGYCPLGDWWDTKDQFPNGMEFIVKEINKRGMKAGIWIAPFVASPSSKLFKEHNDWFLKDEFGKDFEARFTSPFDFIPSLQFRALDVTHPEVQKHLTSIINQFNDWGFEFIKTDFTYPLGFCTNYHQPMTRVQAVRLGFETIKKATGDNVHLMSGITQLSPLLGLMDSVRVGLDIINPFVYGIPVIDEGVNRWMLTQDLRNCEARQFLNGKAWINDADCLVCKPNSGLSENLLDKHFHFITNYGGSKWIGDNLGKLPWDKYENYVLDLFDFTPKKKPAISVVVPAYNEEKTIQKTLSSLSNQQTKIPTEVVVVDNNCTDNTVEIAQTFRKTINGLRIICERTQGIGAARNTGFENSTADIIASTDSDTSVPEDWISRIWGEFWVTDNLVALVGTFTFPSKGRVFNTIVRSLVILADYIHKTFTGSFAFRGSNFAIKKQIWERVGGFNTKLSALEDVELSLRVGKYGKISYISNLVVSTSYRRFEKGFLRQLIKRMYAYFYRVILRSSDKHTDWETIR